MTVPHNRKTANQPVGVDIIGVDALLHGLRPPVGTLAGGLYVHQVQANTALSRSNRFTVVDWTARVSTKARLPNPDSCILLIL